MKPLIMLLAANLSLGILMSNLQAQGTGGMPSPNSGVPLGLSPDTIPQTSAVTDGTMNSYPEQGSGQRGGPIGGVSFYYLKPYLQNNTAFVTTLQPGTPFSQVNSTDFHWNFEPALAVWLGWTTDCGVGVQARYFRFDQSSDTARLTNSATPPGTTQTTVNAPLAGNFLSLSTGGTAFGSPGTALSSGFGTDSLTFGSDLNINMIDGEITYGWKASTWSFLFSGGGRVLSLDQRYLASLSNNGGGAPVNETQLLNYGRKFTGGGLLAGIHADLDLGKTGLFLYANLHGALLVGTTSETDSFSLTFSDTTGVAGGSTHIFPTGNRTADHVMNMAELELGLQYGYIWGNQLLFARVAAVDQTYFDAGNSAQTTGNLSLFGMQVSLGLNY